MFRHTIALVLAGSMLAWASTQQPGPESRAQDAAASRVRLLFELDFDSEARGTARLGTGDLEAALARTSVVTSPTRSGGSALEVRLDRSSGAHRTDFYLRGLGGRSKLGREYWYGFSVRFPEDWQPDTQNELFAQWVRSTETPRGPQLALYVNGEDYVLRMRWDPDPDDGVQMVEQTNLWRGSILEDRGKWVDWVARARWSTGADGTLEVWKDGVSIVRHAGANCYNDGDDAAPYFKFGLYKWPWQKSEDEAPSVVSARRLWFDEIRVGDASASFEAVSPPRR